MNTNPLITIGIPVYNVAAYIEQCLLSALDQTYDNLEILIIDDKGTDHSIDIVQNMMSTHPRGASIRIISNSSNKGVGESRDIALMNAKGEYFYFLDSDDYIAENTIQILYEALVKADVDMSVGSYVNVYSTHSQVTQYDPVLFSGQDAFQRYFFSPPPFLDVVWNKLYKISRLRECGVSFYSCRAYEDTVFTFQLFGAVRSLVLCSDITYYYRRTNQSSLMRLHSYTLDAIELSNHFICLQKMEQLIRSGKVPLNDATFAEFVSEYVLFSRHIAASPQVQLTHKLEWIKKTSQFKPLLNERKLHAKNEAFIQKMYLKVSPFVAWFVERAIFNLRSITKRMGSRSQHFQETAIHLKI